MTTPCRHRFPQAHTQAERPSARAPRLTKVHGPVRSAPSPSVTVRRWHRRDKLVAAVEDTPTGPSGSIANRREIALLEIPRLDLLLRSRAA
jgi:hypothetical protein